MAELGSFTFKLDIPSNLPLLMSDRDVVARILTNLMDNAVKHASAGKVCQIGARSTGSEFRFWVADQGQGMSPEQIQHIFEPFWQADSSMTRTAGGVGLGLYLVKLLASSLGGAISVESQVRAGSRFTVVLPQESTLERAALVAVDAVALLPAHLRGRPTWRTQATLLLEPRPPSERDHGSDQVRSTSLDEVRIGADLFRAGEEVGVLVEGQDDDLGEGHRFLDSGRRFDAVHAWHPKVHENHIRQLFLHQRDGFRSILRLTNDVETLQFEGLAQRRSGWGIIVDDQDAGPVVLLRDAPPVGIPPSYRSQSQAS